MDETAGRLASWNETPNAYIYVEDHLAVAVARD